MCLSSRLTFLPVCVHVRASTNEHHRVICSSQFCSCLRWQTRDFLFSLSLGAHVVTEAGTRVSNCNQTSLLLSLHGTGLLSSHQLVMLSVPVLPCGQGCCWCSGCRHCRQGQQVMGGFPWLFVSLFPCLCASPCNCEHLGQGRQRQDSQSLCCAC